jgi:hypothetical protein
MKQIRDLFIVTSCYATYTFFKIGKKRYIHSSYDGVQVFHILDLEKKEVEVSKTFSNSKLIQALEVKINSKLSNSEHYQMPSSAEDFNEFAEYYEEQDEMLSKEEYLMVQLALLSDNSIERFEALEGVNEKPKYDYFGEPIAYGEHDRQLIDYLISQGDFDTAYKIHKAYIKEIK